MISSYSRRSCVRIAGIPETEHENTDERVLGLAERLIDIGPRDIDKTHCVGPVPVDTDSIDDGARPRPREFIVK